MPRQKTAAGRAKSRANLKPVKKGEVRNPKGINGWPEARKVVEDILSAESGDLAEVLVRIAKRGDVQALKLALGPLAPTRLEVSGPDGRALSFETLVRSAEKTK